MDMLKKNPRNSAILVTVGIALVFLVLLAIVPFHLVVGIAGILGAIGIGIGIYGMLAHKSVGLTADEIKVIVTTQIATELSKYAKTDHTHGGITTLSHSHDGLATKAEVQEIATKLAAAPTIKLPGDLVTRERLASALEHNNHTQHVWARGQFVQMSNTDKKAAQAAEAAKEKGKH